jgi:exoribonuclease R
MPSPPLRLTHATADLRGGFARIRARLGVPETFPRAVEAEASAAALRGHDGRADRRDLPLVSIDPAGARDLDQAFFAERRPGGYRVRYAIADVAAFVRPGGLVDGEARGRGLTLYMPDRRTPLHPQALGEGAASLLPGADRLALVWTIDLDEAGAASAWTLERATVRNRRALAYAEVQAALDRGTADEPLHLLREIGRLRQRREAERDGVSLPLAAQEVVPDGVGYRLRFHGPTQVEAWNAQISLLAGLCAAGTMVRGGIGLFRRMEAPDARTLSALRHTARVLGVPWADGATYGQAIRAMDPARPHDAAFMTRAAHRMRGAGYAAWSAVSGKPPPVHFAVASVYAHVTAPLRRLGDRFSNEIVMALLDGAEPPAWVAAAVPELPTLMEAAERLGRTAERAAVDYVEAVLLAPRVGDVFHAIVVDGDHRRATVQIRDPAVVAKVPDGSLRLGDEVAVRLVSVDTEVGAVAFEQA